MQEPDRQHESVPLEGDVTKETTERDPVAHEVAGAQAATEHVNVDGLGAVHETIRETNRRFTIRQLHDHDSLYVSRWARGVAFALACLCALAVAVTLISVFTGNAASAWAGAITTLGLGTLTASLLKMLILPPAGGNGSGAPDTGPDDDDPGGAPEADITAPEQSSSPQSR